MSSVTFLLNSDALSDESVISRHAKIEASIGRAVVRLAALRIRLLVFEKAGPEVGNRDAELVSIENATREVTEEFLALVEELFTTPLLNRIGDLNLDLTDNELCMYS